MMGNVLQIGLESVHLLTFAALMGTHIAQIVAYSYLGGRSIDQRTMVVGVILSLEKGVMPLAGAGLLLSGVGLVAREGVQNFSQVWVVLLLLIWLVGFLVAKFIGVPALQYVHNESEAHSDFPELSSYMLRWKTAAVFGVAILTIATLVAIIKP